jgi:hypothetical protein
VIVGGRDGAEQPGFRLIGAPVEQTIAILPMNFEIIYRDESWPMQRIRAPERRQQGVSARSFDSQRG